MKKALPRISTLALLLAAATPALRAQQAATHPVTGLAVDDPVVAEIILEGDENSQVMHHLEVLTKRIGPRLTSSSNLDVAVRWAQRKFQEFGLENVRLEEWGTFPVGFDRGLSNGWMVTPYAMPLVFTTRAWTPGTQGPVRGRLKAAPGNPEELEAARGTFGGCWVLAGATRPRFDDDGDSFGAQLGRFLDEEGVLGAIRPGRGELVHTGGNYRVDWDDLPARVEITLLREQMQELGALLESGEEVVLEFDIDNRFVKGPIPLYNVLAEIPGSEKPEELVIIGGHIDSWDGAQGAQDNGTGTSTTLEAARLLAHALRDAGERPRRTIRFTLWSGEEQGLLGSRAYIEQHPEENDRISAVIVHDGGTNSLSGIAATPRLRPILEEALDPVVRMVAGYADPEFEFAVTPVDSLPLGVGSDHDAYLRTGIPGFFWRQSGATSYGFIHHTQHDLYEFAVERYQRHSSKTIAITAWRLGSLPEMLPREDILSSDAGPGERGPRRRLGLTLARDEMRISRISEGGLADRAGMKVGDTLVLIDDASLQSRDDLRSALREDGARKTITVEREGRRLSFVFDWEKGTAEAVAASAKD